MGEGGAHGAGQPCDIRGGQHKPQALQDKRDWNPFVGLSNAAQETIEGLWGWAVNCYYNCLFPVA